jgi:hypothetical protein
MLRRMPVSWDQDYRDMQMVSTHQRIIGAWSHGCMDCTRCLGLTRDNQLHCSMLWNWHACSVDERGQLFCVEVHV